MRRPAKCLQPMAEEVVSDARLAREARCCGGHGLFLTLLSSDGVLYEFFEPGKPPLKRRIQFTSIVPLLEARIDQAIDVVVGK